MKKSLYIVEYDSANGKHYLMHTASGNIVAVDAAKKRQLHEILNAPDHFVKSAAYRKLMDLGFVVPDKRNEFQVISGRRLQRNLCKNNYLHLTIMPTEKCNFRCVYCYENFAKPKMSDEVMESVIKYVKRNISNHKGLIVSWFGGEPLIAIDVIEKLSSAFIEICRQNHKIYTSSITTNAYLLKRNVFEKMRKLHINHFQITIDGNRQIHNRQRVLASGEGTFDQIMYNLKEIRENGKGNLWTVSLRTNVTNSIIHDIEQFKKEVLLPFEEDKRFYIMLRKMWTNDTDAADSLVCSDQEFEIFVNKCGISERSLYQEYTFSHDMNFMCYASNPNSYVIGADGQVYKCTYALYDEINNVGQIDTRGEINLDEEKLSFWIAPKAGNNTECVTCANFAACVSNGCPYRQKQSCQGKTLDVLKYYIPQFYKLAKHSEDLSEFL